MLPNRLLKCQNSGAKLQVFTALSKEMPSKLLWNTHRPMTISPSPRKQDFFIYHTAPNPASHPIGQLENQKEHVFQPIGTYLRTIVKSPFLGRLLSTSPEQHQQTQSPAFICNTLQSIESKSQMIKRSLPPISFCQPQIHAANPRNDGLTSKCHVARRTEDLNFYTCKR
ncbi:hypothetical protein CEXT_365941 [Caerostris extrusa]|uniref:Uncharacterized protein n=1 Tax=Caerostris extrusa TaxID=172846 RepID=A0AAV4VK67_CAEEX|nr:hypothetical protein CEXT_365941 [Caerostris extrusa]